MSPLGPIQPASSLPLSLFFSLSFFHPHSWSSIPLFPLFLCFSPVSCHLLYKLSSPLPSIDFCPLFFYLYLLAPPPPLFIFFELLCFLPFRLLLLPPPIIPSLSSPHPPISRLPFRPQCVNVLERRCATTHRINPAVNPVYPCVSALSPMFVSLFIEDTHTNTLPVTSPPVLSIPSHLIPAYYSHTFTPTCAATTIPSSYPLLSFDSLHVILPLFPLSLMAHVVLSGEIIFFNGCVLRKWFWSESKVCMNWWCVCL